LRRGPGIRRLRAPGALLPPRAGRGRLTREAAVEARLPPARPARAARSDGGDRRRRPLPVAGDAVDGRATAARRAAGADRARPAPARAPARTGTAAAATAAAYGRGRR